MKFLAGTDLMSLNGIAVHMNKGGYEESIVVLTFIFSFYACLSNVLTFHEDFAMCPATTIIQKVLWIPFIIREVLGEVGSSEVKCLPRMFTTHGPILHMTERYCWAVVASQWVLCPLFWLPTTIQSSQIHHFKTHLPSSHPFTYSGAWPCRMTRVKLSSPAPMMLMWSPLLFLSSFFFLRTCKVMRNFYVWLRCYAIFLWFFQHRYVSYLNHQSILYFNEDRHLSSYTVDFELHDNACSDCGIWSYFAAPIKAPHTSETNTWVRIEKQYKRNRFKFVKFLLVGLLRWLYR